MCSRPPGAGDVPSDPIADARLARHNRAMTASRHLLLPLALAVCSPACGQSRPVQSRPEQPRPAPLQVRGMTAAQAGLLLDTLKDAQARLGRGENLYFELLSGSLASYSMTRVSPREAFLQMKFETAFIIERVPTDNLLWQPYKLAVTDRPGKLVWDIEVVLGSTGTIERVEMLYKPPAPF